LIEIITKIIIVASSWLFIKKYIFFENPAVYEIMWKNILEPDRSQMTIWLMRIAYWIPKATDTHSEYVKLIAL
jgi:hypothetical protein